MRKRGEDERKCDMFDAGGAYPCDFHCCPDISGLGNYRCFNVLLVLLLIVQEQVSLLVELITHVVTYY